MTDHRVLKYIWLVKVFIKSMLNAELFPGQYRFQRWFIAGSILSHSLLFFLMECL